MQSISQNDINLFKVVTEANDSTAKSYLLRFKNFSAALDAFFKSKPQEPSLLDADFQVTNETLTTKGQNFDRTRQKKIQQSSSKDKHNRKNDLKEENQDDNGEIMDLEKDRTPTAKSSQGKVSANKNTVDAFAYFRNLTQTDDMMDDEEIVFHKEPDRVSAAPSSKTKPQELKTDDVSNENTSRLKDIESAKKRIANVDVAKQPSKVEKLVECIEIEDKDNRNLKSSQRNSQPRELGLQKSSKNMTNKLAENKEQIETEEGSDEQDISNRAKKSRAYINKDNKPSDEAKSFKTKQNGGFKKIEEQEENSRTSQVLNKTLEIEDESVEVSSCDSPEEPEISKTDNSSSRADEFDEELEDNGYDEPEQGVRRKESFSKRKTSQQKKDLQLDEEFESDNYEEPEEGVRKKVTFSNSLKNPEVKESHKFEETKAPALTNPPQSDKPNIPDLPYKLKNTYEDYVKPYIKKIPTKGRSKGRNMKQEEDKKKDWPKFLGSLLVECKLSSAEFADKIKVHDTLQLNTDPVKFTYSTVKKTQKIKDKERSVYKKNWTIKGNSLIVRCHWKGHLIGQLKCYNEEIFVFLLTKRYIFLEAVVLDVIKSSSTNVNINSQLEEAAESRQAFMRLFANLIPVSKIKVQLNIFLTEQVILEPLNIMSTPGKKQSKNKRSTSKDDPLEDDEGHDDESQKLYQLLKYTKESLARLFYILSVKISIPSVVQVRHRFDPFKRLRREKQNADASSNSGFDDASGVQPGLIMSALPNYYKRFQINEKSSKNSQISRWTPPKYQESIYDDNDDDEDEDEDDYELLSDVQSYIEEDDEEDEERYGRTPTKSGKSSGSKISEADKDRRNSQIKETEEDKANNDILNTKDQISNYFQLSDPPYTFKSELHVYQKQALAWMLHRETRKDAKDLYNESYVQERMLNELFQEMELPDGSKMYFNGFNGEVSVEFPRSKTCKGGILADEMGLGKTVMTIALLHAHRRNIAEMQANEQNEAFDDFFTLSSYSKKDKKVTRQDSFDSLGFAGNKSSKNRKLEKKAGGISKNSYKISTRDDMNNTRKNKKIKRGDDYDDLGFGSKDFDVQNDDLQPEDFAPLRKNNGIARKDSFDLMGFGMEETYKAGTLIVVPLTVLSQWESEINTHSRENTLTILQYYGTNKKKTRLGDYDVVLTTYGILESEFAKQKDREPSGIFKYEWFRVILDEAHSIKSRSTKTAKAAFDLNVEFRWCLTGTPIQNKLDDLFSLLHFLRLETWGDYFWWNTYVNHFRSKEEASTLVRGILKSILIRRTKKSTYLDGRNILELPKKEIKTHMVNLTREERKIYECFYRGSAGQFNDIVDGGTLQYEYAHIFELFIRLRQVCNHPALVFTKEDLKDQESLQTAVLKFLEKRIQNTAQKKAIKGKSIKDEQKFDQSKMDQEDKEEKAPVESQFISQIIQNLKSKELEPCSICLEEIAEPMITNCGHIFCKSCINQSIEKYHKCPLCKQEITARDVMSISLEDPELSQNLIDMDSKDFKKSSKLGAIIDAVREVAQKGEKCVIFSQFNGMLNLIERFLDVENFAYRRIDGSKTLKQRIQYIEDFKNDKKVTVFLISLKAGGIGLNLTVANHVFVVDPWWNPAVEDQAIERVHRIGQQKDVHVIRFICSKTIEERILELQANKKDLINMTLHFNPEQQKRHNMANMMHVMKGFDENE